jgi:thiol-disulfide isomerase/thioredoxin
MNRLKITLIGLLVVMITAGVVYQTSRVQAQDDEPVFTYAGTIAAPDFPADLNWLNVEKPLTMQDLRGKIVLLDFWTYGCINCIHIIPELKKLEEAYPNELVIIGVHSAKFEGEGVTDNIRQIVQRYGVEHPVVNDKDFVVWQAYGAEAWPSLYLIDPKGNVVGRISGESVPGPTGQPIGLFEFFSGIFDTMIEEYGTAGLLNTTPLALAPETANMVDTPLMFPGKVLVDEVGNRLFISDSGHNRIIIARLDNFEVLEIIGNGQAALVDGDYQTASFNTPQGMALVGNTLYVADTNNHAIRAVDLISKTVSLVAGTGEKAEFIFTGGDALELSLRSPWDVVEQDGILYIAMAGTHQLWELNLSDMTMQPFAGNGREDLIDGARLDAELAQPSGVVSDGIYIYFADSESSSVRRAGITEDGTVETLIGPVNNDRARLFDFGDVDGDAETARLQHPLGVTLDDNGLLYVADTYNNKIKLINPVAKTSTTFAGNATGGYFDGSGEEALFDEPGGLDFSNGKLYIADTNNHAIRIINIEDRSVATVVFPNVTVLLPESQTTLTDDTLDSTNTTFLDTLLEGDDTKVLPVQTVAPGEGVIMVDAVMPFGYKLNASAPFTATWAEDSIVTVPAELREYKVVTPELPIQFPVTLTEGETNLSVDLIIYWCEAIKETLCFVERRTVVMPVVVSPDAAGSVLSLSYQLIPPEVPANTFDGS